MPIRLRGLLGLFILSFVSFSVRAGGGPTSSDLVNIKSVIQKYRESVAVKMAVKKTVFIALLEQERKSQGDLYFSKGRLRMELKQPDQSLLILNGKTIWVVEQAPKELGGRLQVAKISMTGRQKKSNAVLAFLFGDEALWDEFQVKDKTSKGPITAYELRPNNDKVFPGVSKLALTVNSRTKKIRKLSYWDEQENKTSYLFADIDFGVKIPEKKFSYKPPKGANVTVY